MYIPKDLLPVEARENTLRKVEEVLSRFSKDGVPLLDPEEDMEVRISNACHIVRFPLLISL
jgi:ATP-dependent RNA helicase DOB1